MSDDVLDDLCQQALERGYPLNMVRFFGGKWHALIKNRNNTRRHPGSGDSPSEALADAVSKIPND